eukprot:7778111-Alexandrium_andersonii.AAC.1
MPSSCAASSAGPDNPEPGGPGHGGGRRLASPGDREHCATLDSDEPLLPLTEQDAQRPGRQVGN